MVIWGVGGGRDIRTIIVDKMVGEDGQRDKQGRVQGNYAKRLPGNQGPLTVTDLISEMVCEREHGSACARGRQRGNSEHK